MEQQARRYVWKGHNCIHQKEKKQSAKVTAHPSSNIIHHRRLLASAEQRHQQRLRSRDGNMGTRTDMFTGSVVEELLWLEIHSTSKSFDVLPVQLNPQYSILQSRPVPQCKIFTLGLGVYLKIRLHPLFCRYKDGESYPNDIKATGGNLQHQCQWWLWLAKWCSEKEKWYDLFICIMCI